MKSNRFKLIAGALAILLLVTAAAVSQTVKRAHMRGEGIFGGPGSVHFLTRYLDLDDAQRAQVKDILSKQRATTKPLMQQLHQTQQQERAIVQAGTFDEAQARALATQRSQTMVELAVQKMKVESQLYQVLNTDQKAKLNEMLDKHEQGFQQRQEQQRQKQAPSQ